MFLLVKLARNADIQNMRTMRRRLGRCFCTVFTLSLVCCEDTENINRIKELEEQISSLEEKVAREKDDFALKDKKRDEALQAKLRDVEDVRVVLSQLEARVRTIGETTTGLKEYISKLEQQLRSASGARAERNQRIDDLNQLADASRKVPVLTLKNGKTYRDAVLTNFGESGFGVLHAAGSAQVPYDQLPDDLRRFQPPECPAVQLPERPDIDMDAASDYQQCFPVTDTSRINDEKLRRYLTQSNQVVSDLAELGRDLSQARGEVGNLAQKSSAEQIRLQSLKALAPRSDGEIQNEMIRITANITNLVDAIEKEQKRFSQIATTVREHYRKHPALSSTINNDVARQEAASTSVIRQLQNQKAALESQLAEMEKNRVDELRKADATYYAGLKAHASDRKLRDANLSAAAIRDRLERTIREARGRKALIEERLVELISHVKAPAKG